MRTRLAAVVLTVVGAILIGVLPPVAQAQQKESAKEQGTRALMVEGPLGIPLPKERRTEAANVLQQELATLIDLHLKSKQLHWNVVGPRFRPLHLQLDEIAEIAQEGTDLVAERMLTLGASPDGRAATVAAQSALGEVPTGLVQDAKVVDVTAQLLATTSDRLHKALQALDDVDLVSQDLLIDLAQKIDKQLWMIQAQQY